MPPKIALMYVTAGSGHKSAAYALAEALAVYAPHAEVTVNDFLDFGPAPYRFIFTTGYEKYIARMPFVWRNIYQHLNLAKNQKRTDAFSRWAVARKLRSFLITTSPDLIIATHPLPARVITSLDIQTPIVQVITDYGCHSYWIDRATAAYFVGDETVREQTITQGIASERVYVSGLPISQRFTTIGDRTALCKKHGLNPQQPIVLMIGGHLRAAAVQRTVTTVQKHIPRCQWLLVAGRDKKLERQLRSSSLAGQAHIRIYGFTRELNELMDIASVVCTKAGGLTVAECFAKGLPMILYGILPGQEEDNACYVYAAGAGVYARQTGDIAQQMIRLLQTPELLAMMRKKALLVGKKDAAESIVRNLIRLNLLRHS